MKSTYILLALAAYCHVTTVSGRVVLPGKSPTQPIPLANCLQRLPSVHKHLCNLMDHLGRAGFDVLSEQKVFLPEIELAEDYNTNSMSSEEDTIQNMKHEALVNCCIRPCSFSELIYLC